jgi:hypothetical protein
MGKKEAIGVIEVYSAILLGAVPYFAFGHRDFPKQIAQAITLGNVKSGPRNSEKIYNVYKETGYGSDCQYVSDAAMVSAGAYARNFMALEYTGETGPDWQKFSSEVEKVEAWLYRKGYGCNEPAYGNAKTVLNELKTNPSELKAADLVERATNINNVYCSKTNDYGKLLIARQMDTGKDSLNLIQGLFIISWPLYYFPIALLFADGLSKGVV